MTVYFGRCGALDVIVSPELVEKIGQIDGVVACSLYFCGDRLKWHTGTVRYIKEIITEEELEQAIRAL